jgi:pullulanase/glycogen debranching enzyme
MRTQAGLKTPGGLAAGIDHLVELGVTAVQLMPIYNHTAEGEPWTVDERLAAKCYNFMCSSLTRFYRPTPDRRRFSNATGTDTPSETYIGTTQLR